VAAAAVGSSPSASAAPSAASQLAYQRSFQELTGVSNTAQIATLLSLLNHDLDRAIAVFFSEDPPSMLSALEKARSIQQNAMQQQQQHQQQQQQQQQQHLASPHMPSPQHQQQQQHQPQAQLMGGVYSQQQPFGAAVSHPAPPAQSTQTQIQVLLPDGSPFLVSCLSSDTMWTLYERVSAPLQSRAAWANLPIAFSLLTYPHTRFNEDRFNTSMAEAGLVPHGQLRIELMR
jgi:Sec-independent protein translocase protein TatA